MKRIEKHNVLDIIKKENLEDFTVECIERLVRNKYRNMWYSYGYYISNCLFELVNDDEISVVYVSKRCTDGFRTVGVYMVVF